MNSMLISRVWITLFVVVGIFFSIVRPVLSEEGKLVRGAVRVPVFYATDRVKITSNKDAAGETLGPLHLGLATALLPKDLSWLDGSDSLKSTVAKLGWVLDNDAITIVPYIEVRGYVAEPDSSVVLSNVQDSPDFWTALSAEADASPFRTVYVYIHGFASSGDNSVYAAGVLSSCVESPVVAFSWPSEGTVGLKPLQVTGKKRIRARYLADRKMIDREEVLKDLTTFLSELKRKLPDKRICLVAHSLGNRLLANYICSPAPEQFDEVYFLAADVDHDLFMRSLANLKTKSKHTSVWLNPKDKVLKIAGANDLLSLRVTRKLGKANFSVPDIEFVNYEKIAQPRSLNYLNLQHYVPFEQFASIVRTGSPFSKSEAQYYLFRSSKIEKARH